MMRLRSQCHLKALCLKSLKQCLLRAIILLCNNPFQSPTHCLQIKHIRSLFNLIQTQIRITIAHSLLSIKHSLLSIKHSLLLIKLKILILPNLSIKHNLLLIKLKILTPPNLSHNLLSIKLKILTPPNLSIKHNLLSIKLKVLKYLISQLPPNLPNLNSLINHKCFNPQITYHLKRKVNRIS